MGGKPYKIINHTADVGIRVQGKTLPLLFERSAYALFDIMVNLRDVKKETEETILIEGFDLPELLVSWLNHFLFLRETRSFLFRKFRVHEFHDTSLRATAWGERFDPERHEFYREIKAATYHNLLLRERRGLWQAEIILDI